MPNKQKAWRLGAAILKTLPQFKSLPEHKKPSARALKTLATPLGAAWRRGEGASSALHGDKVAKLLPQALTLKPRGQGRPNLVTIRNFTESRAA